MIERKKKICRGKGKYVGFGCNTEQYIFSNGCCQTCSQKADKVVKGGNGGQQGRSGLKQAVFKPTGYKKLFEDIWDEREHVSEISGEPLLPKGHPQWHWQFSHVVESPYKGFGFPLRKDNVVLMLPEEHTMYGERTTEAKKDPRFNWVFKKKIDLILEYNKLKKI